jgi:hypothetical protein
MSGQMKYDGVKTFSATKFADRLALGDRVTEWLKSANVEIVQKWVMQSSDEEFHCLSIIFAYRLLPT